MTPENSDLAVHDLIGRLFEEPEPSHRTDLADGAIAHGMAATRRRGFAVAGATVSVLAVVAGSVAIAGGGRGAGTDWSLPAEAQMSPKAYESPAPSYSDRQWEIMKQLPGVLGPLLPSGMTVRRDPNRSIGGTSTVTGDFGGEFTLHSGGRDFYIALQPDGAGFVNAFAKNSAKPLAVAGGTIQMTVVPEPNPQTGGPGFNAWYEFAPSAPGAPRIDFNVYGEGTDTTPIDLAAFKKMVEAPGFAQLRQLLDPSVQASVEAVAHRYALEAQINAEAAKVLPPGLRLKLDPGAPGMLELVGPTGVNTFDWFATTSGPKPQTTCDVGKLCYDTDPNGPFARLGPDGVARLGEYKAGSGTPSDPDVILYVYGRPMTGDQAAINPTVLGKDGSETAPQGPGLTPQQARAIMRAPGIAKVIADVRKLVAQD